MNARRRAHNLAEAVKVALSPEYLVGVATDVNVVISKPCNAHMCGCCDVDDCAHDCHQSCAECNEDCQATYNVATSAQDEPRLVCASCYVKLTKNVVRARCEGCSAPYAYRDIAVGNVYLCVDCHQAVKDGKLNPA